MVRAGSVLRAHDTQPRPHQASSTARPCVCFCDNHLHACCVQVCRAFEDADVIHVEDRVDPVAGG
jgi:hypothetical protein